jgi:glycerol-3-phosphate acyltransferase PlsY
MRIFLIAIAFIVAGFFLGAIPFSVWLGKILIRKDVRDFGDGNPGAMNTFRAGNFLVGFLVLMLDISKGVLPIAVAIDQFALSDIALVLIAIAPVLGHAFSPFLGFKGGKAIAVTLGVWIGLTIWKIPLIAVVSILIARMLLDSDAWSMIVALVSMSLAVIFWLPSPVHFLVLGMQIIILTWKQWSYLQYAPHFNKWSLLRKKNK